VRKRLYWVAGGVAVSAAALAIWLALSSPPRLPVDEIPVAGGDDAPPGRLAIQYPFDGTVFPPEIAPPTFHWQAQCEPDVWVVTLAFPDGQEAMRFESVAAEWTPSEEAWGAIKRRSIGKRATVTVLGVRRAPEERILSAGSISISTSCDEVGAPIFYREVNLPFRDAVKDPSRIRWRFGDVSSRSPPPVVLENLPACGNCHSFSADGKMLGMDIDYANDKGSYAILPVERQMVLDPTKIITWSDYKKEDHELTFGLLSQISPDGRHVISTVKDESVFVPREDLAFSQLFFPIKGILAVYSRETGTFRALPGADDPEYVQSNPSWSPDGKTIVFARSKRYRLKHAVPAGTPLLTAADCVEFLSQGKTFLFDLCCIPFNGGRGGKAEPPSGASGNGMSNYFARYSPDGKWIVFCEAKTFMLLQPDSELYILPSSGGEPRRLRCNMGRMNSWHSWSPNGKWLVFSSKAFSPYTQLFLTHIGPSGDSDPPVVLSRFTTADRAANIPEFVRAESGAIGEIREQFLNDYTYTRLARTNIQFGDLERAEAACRKALALNPKNTDALCKLGIALWNRGKNDEAWGCFAEALRQDPKQADAHLNMAEMLVEKRQSEDAIGHYRLALAIDPGRSDGHFLFGKFLLALDRLTEAAEHLALAVRLRPQDSRARYFLGASLQRQGKLEDALGQYGAALEESPDFVPALVGAAIIRATIAQPSLRDRAEAMRLAQRACELTKFKDPGPMAGLATVYAEMGNFPEAVMAARRAAQVARGTGNEVLARQIENGFQQYLRRNAPSTPKPR
jgi:tetratricopeptide (TPR) repeat protein